MKRILFILIIFYLNGCTKPMEIKIPIEDDQKKNSFQNIWDIVAKNPLKTLPHDKVSFFKLSSQGRDIILEDSTRTLNNHADILKSFNKLAHPNGICFKGIWEIHNENIYSGYFKKGNKALIIARASSAMSNTNSGELRSFGLAGKIFPTLNPNEIDQENSANFFLIDDLGGTDATHYTDTILTNEPSVSMTSEVLKNLLYAIKVAKTFAKADQNAGIRQLYEISYLGKKETSNIITPKWMKVEAKEKMRVNTKDFRDELHINKDGKKLIFNISVANKSTKNQKNWQQIGTITFDTSVVSKACDHQLHFHHPKWRSNLNYGD